MRAPSILELSRNALRSNLRFLRRKIGKGVELSSVVKGNAYGHGIEEFVPLAEECGVRHFSVFSATEAERVRRNMRRQSRIVIMGDIHNGDLPWAIEHGIEFFVFDLDRLDAAVRASKKVGRPAGVHLEVETGLHRTGLSARSLLRAAQRLLRHPEQLHARGLCTHLAGAESSANHYRIQRQLEAFRARSERFAELGFPDVPRHAACSAATLNYPEAIGDLARIGIAQYGFWPSEETRLQHLGTHRHRRTAGGEGPLRRILSWKSHVLNLKTVKPGQFIGYGNSYLSSRRMRVAAVPVGYADGFLRHLSNRGRVLVGGERCSVVGNVNMSVMLVDVSPAPRAEVGDEVVLIGHQGNHEISVGAFGELIHQLNYEVLTRLPADIPRVVVD